MDYQGYWGPITASVDWCENNYVYSYYIAEIFNTLSSISMILVGEFGARYNYTNHWKQRLCFRMISVIGLGSMLFHSSLKYSTQMLDELPMVWTAGLVLSLSLEATLQDQFNPIINYFLFIYTCVSTFLTAFTHGENQVFLFRLSYTTVELSAVAVGILSYSKLPKNSKLRASSKNALLLALIALLCWITDNEKCATLRKMYVNPQLHAFWHFFISLAVYHGILLSIHKHQNGKATDDRIEYFLGVIPYITKKAD